jgi:hypothetical protein
MNTETLVKPETEKVKRTVILAENRAALAEYERQDWVVNAEEGTTIEDVQEPGYWAHVAARMKPYDRIEVRLETGEWIAELVVVAVDRNWARVSLLGTYDLTVREGSVPSAQKHKVLWKGPQHKFCVIRISDDQLVQGGFTDKDAANVWMRNHENVTSVA